MILKIRWRVKIMMAVKFTDGSGKLFVVREYATMRDGQTLVKISDRDGNCIWVSADCLEVFEA